MAPKYAYPVPIKLRVGEPNEVGLTLYASGRLDGDLDEAVKALTEISASVAGSSPMLITMALTLPGIILAEQERRDRDWLTAQLAKMESSDAVR